MNSTVMVLTNKDLSARECQVFTHYLCGLSPSAYIVEKYEDAQHRNQTYAVTGRFERFLINFASLHPSTTRLADIYARLFVPTSVLRKRLILLLAILESTAFSDAFLERIDSSSRIVLIWQAFLRGFVLLVGVLLSFIVLFPSQILLGHKSSKLRAQ